MLVYAQSYIMEWRFIMRNRFDRELVRLNNELIEMGSMIEKSIETADQSNGKSGC